MTTESTEKAVFTARGVLRGLARGLPLMLASVAGGIAIGAVLRQLGFTTEGATLFSATVFSGTAQAAAAQLWHDPLPTAAIVVAAAAVTARYLVMGAKLRTVWPDLPARKAIPVLALLTDTGWLFALTDAETGRRDAGVAFGACLGQLIGWTSGTAIGALLGALPSGMVGAMLLFLPVAMISGLLAQFWRGRAQTLPWLVSAAAALLLDRWLPTHWCLLLGASAGTLLALVRRER